MISPPRKAFILAAGFGTRMAPLSHDLPKAIMPVCNRSLLARHVEMLTAWGVRDILVNVHHGADQVFDEVRALARRGYRIELSFEPEILGTGGALQRAAWFFDDQPFWLINADIVAQLDPRPLQAAMRRQDTLASLWMDPVRGPRTVAVRKGRVIDFQSRNGVTFCGLHLLRRNILAYLPDQGFSSIIPAYQNAMRDGWNLAAVEVPGSYWADVGTPERYLQVHGEMGKGRRAAISPSAVVHPKAKVARSVVWPGAVLTASADVRDAIVGRDVHVYGSVSGVVVAAVHGLDDLEINALLQLGWNPAQTSVQVLAPRGSSRSFYRLRAHSRTAMLVRYDASRAENALYAPLTRFLLQQKWPVPHLLWDAPDVYRSLYADAGEMTLPATESAYKRVLDEVLRLQGPVTKAFRRRRISSMPAFDADTYAYERSLFCDQYLHGQSPSLIRQARKELEQVAGRLLKIPPVLVHRDLQSSNIHWQRGRPVFIDYQGMRLGPAAYDVASLLLDPYVSLSAVMQQRLVTYYAARAQKDVFEAEHMVWAGIQRLCQALGAYVRLSKLPGCAGFQKHIPAALCQLRRQLVQVPELVALGEIARDNAHQ